MGQGNASRLQEPENHNNHRPRMSVAGAGQEAGMVVKMTHDEELTLLEENEALREENARLRKALELIAKPGYGLDLNTSIEDRALYWEQVVATNRWRASEALASARPATAEEHTCETCAFYETIVCSDWQYNGIHSAIDCADYKQADERGPEPGEVTQIERELCIEMFGDHPDSIVLQHRVERLIAYREAIRAEVEAKIKEAKA